MNIGDRVEMRGFVTSEKFLINQTLPEIEERLGFHKGRLSQGATFLIAERLPQKGEFEPQGYSQVAGHKQLPTLDQKIAPGGPLEGYRKDALLTMAQNAMAEDRLVKVVPKMEHNPGMSNDQQYPPGKGVPQWELTSKIPFKVESIVEAGGKYVGQQSSKTEGSSHSGSDQNKKTMEEKKNIPEQQAVSQTASREYDKLMQDQKARWDEREGMNNESKNKMMEKFKSETEEFNKKYPGFKSEVEKHNQEGNSSSATSSQNTKVSEIQNNTLSPQFNNAAKNTGESKFMNKKEGGEGETQADKGKGEEEKKGTGQMAAAAPAPGGGAGNKEKSENENAAAGSADQKSKFINTDQNKGGESAPSNQPAQGSRFVNQPANQAPSPPPPPAKPVNTQQAPTPPPPQPQKPQGQGY
ncbi:MAG: hypothetical protein KF862_08415 [Chitinophagaceae bacterium]|nr:hypothetical protein [Chitinophagaceae bacterium]